MGTTNRTGKKTTKKASKKIAKKAKKAKTAKKPTTKPLFDPDADSAPRNFGAELDSVATEVEMILAAMADRLAATLDDEPFPQSAMACAPVIARLQSALKAAAKVIDEAALDHRKEGGAFEVGRVQFAVKSTGGKRSVGWKDEATEQARKHEALSHGVNVVLEDGLKAEVLQTAMEYDFNAKAYQDALLNAVKKPDPKETALFTPTA